MRNLYLASVYFFVLQLPSAVFGQVQGIYETDSGIEYLAYLPEEYKTNNSSPLLLFLHGLGEKGDDLIKVQRFGPPKMIANGSWPDNLPFVVISPQLPSKYNAWPPHLVDHILDEVSDKFSINQTQIYLTGLSLGGIGTWEYAIKNPNKLAAIIPICGKGNPGLACELEDLPVWAFHGDQDGIVKPSGSINMIEALRKCKGRDNELTKFTLYPGVKHDSWTRTYKNLEIYDWLLTFKNEKIPNGPSNGGTNLDDKTVGQVKQMSTVNPDIRELCILPAAIDESSGLQSCKNGFLWTHNDSGGQPVIYQIDTTGKINKFITITNATNYDWEDLAKDAEDNLYIGDFGNNQNNRKKLQIYKIANPENLKVNRVKAEVIEFFYPDQKDFPPSPSSSNFDVEAMIIFNQHIYLFTKNNTEPFDGMVKLYKLPSASGSYRAELLDSLYLDTSDRLGNLITGADISPDQKKIALLTYNKVILLSNYKEDDFFQGAIKEIVIPSLSQKEGITFKNNSAVYITDERFKNLIGGNLYLMNLDAYIKN